MFNYWCKNRSSNPGCEFCSQKGDLQIDEEGEYTCPSNSDCPLKLLGQSVSGQIGVRMTKEQIKADRKKRSSQHFQKEILPNFDAESTEGKHFRKKYGYKK